MVVDANFLPLASKGISLDTILDYEIQPMISYFKQFMSVKMSAAVTMIMFVFDFLSSSMSLITFRQSQSHEVGCSKYLLDSSIVCLLTMMMFTLKFWSLLLTQMSIITHPKFSFINCLLMEISTKVYLSTSNWLSPYV